VTSSRLERKAMLTTAKPMRRTAREADAHDGIFSSPGHLFRRCHQITVGIFLQECAALDLTPLQFAVIAALRVHGPMDQTTLGGIAALDRTTVAVVLRGLEARGLVVRARSESDRRAKIVAITKAGEHLFEDALAPAEDVQRRLLSPLDASEQAVLLGLLHRVVEANNAFSRAPARFRDEHDGDV
jgi:DNA-binding MarR family transcriptional regulator